jgi:aryl-alcohol dehydrogenase-like predicted oxidoreductase
MLTLPASFSRLGLGVTGPHATPAVRPDDTVALIRAAIAEGVTLFDTGPMYGAGEGERRLGAALDGAPRADVFVCTKARTWPMRPGDDDGSMSAPDRVRRSLDESLRRLRLDRVDALLLHGPRPEDFTSALLDALSQLRAEGRVGAVGVCGRGPELDAALACDGFDLLMAPLSGRPATLETAARKGVAVMAIETMRGAAPVWRVPASGADLWYLARAARDALAGASPPPDLGIAAALSQPAVRTVVVQTTRLAHLRENAAASRLRVGDPDQF